MNKSEWCLKAKGKRPNRAWIWNETYTQGCYVLWPVTSEQLQAEYLHINKTAEFKEGDFDISLGKFLTAGGISCIAFTSRKPTVGVIAHESMHLVNHLYDILGIRPSLNNDEPQTYLLNWAVDKVYNLTRGVK